MSIGHQPSEQILTIPDGFGQRLREERERMRLSQSALADIGGIRRLAQSQYEKELSSPTVRYLAAIAQAGANLEFVLFGRPTSLDSLSPAARHSVEEEAFRRVEAFVRSQPAGQLGAEGRFALFQVFRTNLQAALCSEPDKLN